MCFPIGLPTADPMSVICQTEPGVTEDTTMSACGGMKEEEEEKNIQEEVTDIKVEEMGVSGTRFGALTLRVVRDGSIIRLCSW